MSRIGSCGGDCDRNLYSMTVLDKFTGNEDEDKEHEKEE